jgi:hypothetical protein
MPRVSSSLCLHPCYPKPQTLNLDPRPSTLDPRPSTLDPKAREDLVAAGKARCFNLKLQTPNPKP